MYEDSGSVRDITYFKDDVLSTIVIGNTEGVGAFRDTGLGGKVVQPRAFHGLAVEAGTFNP